MRTTVLWRRLDLPGHEVARLTRRKDRWELSGTAVFLHERRPCRLDYVVICTPDWLTTSAHVRGWIGDREIDLAVSATGEQQWRLNGTEIPGLAGCVDIDLGFSPSTNLLPIRRLALDIGQEAEVRAAWLSFPSLMLEVLPQVYRREGVRTYRYESGGGAFVRLLEVNAEGFVTRYPGFWEAESAP